MMLPTPLESSMVGRLAALLSRRAGVYSRALRGGNDAEVRSKALLCRLLTAQQSSEHTLHGCFSVAVPGRGRYWILPRTYFNVVHAESGYSYCALPRVNVPVADLMLAQKLMLENDPNAFFRIANCRREFDPSSYGGAGIELLLRTPMRFPVAATSPFDPRIHWQNLLP
jgi:hypothetical protein